MLRLTVGTGEYLMIGEDVKLVFLGGTGKYLRIMVDAPKNKNIVRSTVLEKNITDPEERAKLPQYYPEQEHPEKYVKKPRVAVAQQEHSQKYSQKPRIIIARGTAEGGRG